MDNKTLGTGLTILAFVIGIIGLIMGIMIMAGNEAVIGSAINLSLIVMAACAGIAVLFGVFHLFTNIKKNIPLLAGIIAFVVLAIICYSLAGDEVLRSYGDISSTTSKLSGGGLMIMYVLVVVALISAVVGEVSRIFK